jgi:hypothetical protein
VLGLWANALGTNGDPVVLDIPPELAGVLRNDDRGGEHDEMSVRLQHGGCLDEADVGVDPVEGVACEDGVERRIAGNPRLEGGRSHRDARKPAKVLAGSSGEVRAELQREDPNAALRQRRVACPVPGPISRTVDPDRNPASRMVSSKTASGAAGSSAVVGVGICIEAPPERVSLARLPRFRRSRAHAHQTDPERLIHG